MLEKLTEESRRVIVLSQEFAVKHNHVSIEVPDLLCGLVAQGGIASSTIESFTTIWAIKKKMGDHDYERVPAEAEIRSIARELLTRQPQFERDVATVFDFSLREALRLGSNQIKPEHMLLGLSRIDGALDFIPSVTPDELRNVVIRKLSAQPWSTHLIQWTPAMEKEAREFLRLVETVTDIMGKDAISLAKLRMAVGDVAVSAESFEKALSGATLPARKPS